ncbi:MAG: AAA family ATPase [Novosphingobium sp.]|nr:AAA family ATPase [Novosphingobium sp.]
MARLCPALPPRSALTAGDHAELDLLDTLERGLSSAYTLFHSVDWSKSSGEREQHGEIDIVVVNQAGDVLLMEVKSGGVEFRPEGIFKAYGARFKDVTAQVRQQYGALRSRLQDAGLPVQVRHLLVLPDVRVQSATVQWPRERIVDSADIADIVSKVAELLGPGSGAGKTSERVLAFFENRFRVEPDVSALAGRLRLATTRLSAGLATWVPRIEAPSGVIRVVGTAGSGKTQLALRLLRDADAAGRKTAYICFNRALADHIARVVPARVPAETFHEFALRFARRSAQVVDFGLPTAFQALADYCTGAMAQVEPDLDLLVLDEVQDLQPEWVQAMLARLRPEGRALLLEDPAQQLYLDRVPFDVDDAVTVTSHENFRSPRAIVRLINGLRLTGTEVEALSPYDGEIPDPIVYERPDQIASCTASAVERCLQRGFGLDDIAIVSMRGRERSAVLGGDRLESWTLRRFTGNYDEGGGAIWTEGQLLIDTVRRFKGQAAGAIVLTECDLVQLDPISRRLLFVGLTRARMHLEWVISGATALMLKQSLQN